MWTCTYMKQDGLLGIMNCFHYSKKLFIHYILVPGRQVPFLVRGGHGHPGPHGKIAYDNNIKKSQFVREMDGHNSDLMYYEPGTSQTPGYRLRIDAATLDTGRFLNGIFRKCWNGNLANFG